MKITATPGREHLQLNSILHIQEADKYKVHLASWNGHVQPLNVFVRSRDEWDGWNRYRSSKNDFNRPYIFSLIDFFPEPNEWLFGGIYKVIKGGRSNHSHSYTIARATAHEGMVGRLKIRFTRPSRTKALKLENYYGSMTVTEILPEPYAGERFPGYEDICHDFSVLEPIFEKQRLDWKAALENVKGVYLVSDRLNGKKYIGSAYGGAGIWSRWNCYMGNGHGGNDELAKLLRRKGLE